jgi:hypothetical protein
MGGLGGGGEISQMARQVGQQSARASTDAQAEIARIRQAGKLEGLGGLSQLEQAAASGRLRAGEGAQAFGENVATGRRASISGLGELETNVAGGQRGIESDVAGGVRSGASLLAQIESDIASGKRTGAQGLTALYGLSLEDATNLGKEILQKQQLTGQLTTAQMEILQDLAKQPGVFDNIIRAVSAGAGVISAVTGIPGIGGKRKPSPRGDR